MSDEITRIGPYRLTAIADVPDFRDWEFTPSLRSLKKELARPARLHILDQGDEGSCTGFALAAAVNLLRRRGRRSGKVSPRMLYEMAKRHDEWRGFRAEGSSCRGAIKGWYNMGVCLEKTWPYVDGEPGLLTIKAAKEARRNTLGAYYRLGTRIADFHSALNEAGVIYCSADVHDGWDLPTKHKPVIPLRDDNQGGHAFCIVGYNTQGFWVQNSWTRDWGDNGTALWLYEDWQQNVYDAWVFGLALSTPQIWHLPREGGSDAGRTKGLFRRTPTRAEIAGHFVHLDDGRFHEKGRYWSTASDAQQTAELLAKSNKYDHLLLYAHGGLNNIKDSARRIASMKETFKANRIYPYHFMYDTGLLEELKDVVVGHHKKLAERAAGLTSWMDKLLEQASQKAGRALWREMKRGAETPFSAAGAGSEVLNFFIAAFAAASSPIRLHLAGHSTGAIFHASLLARLAMNAPENRVASASLLAPAATVELFRQHYLPWLKTRRPAAGIDKLDIYCLNDELEKADSVAGVYRKSILYLVSHAYEEDPLPAPLLGMARYNNRLAARRKNMRVIVSDGDGKGGRGLATRSRSHAEFDNDVTTMNSVLRRILGKKPATPFTEKTLKY
ncbi:MAG: C1 family peptidase [Woeseia sp.]|nr:C1 family peptidase [Woeseia sp.]MBT8097097.1 C1 family peptidase [Woeseia sp.]NNE62047.1 C1 family peptidase [Woeseia sp.]NNL53658.1 C1 family peptidase [Woeseia sp.]